MTHEVSSDKCNWIWNEGLGTKVESFIGKLLELQIGVAADQNQRNLLHHEFHLLPLWLHGVALS